MLWALSKQEREPQSTCCAAQAENCAPEGIGHHQQGGADVHKHSPPQAEAPHGRRQQHRDLRAREGCLGAGFGRCVVGPIAPPSQQAGDRQRQLGVDNRSPTRTPVHINRAHAQPTLVTTANAMFCQMVEPAARASMSAAGTARTSFTNRATAGAGKGEGRMP